MALIPSHVFRLEQVLARWRVESGERRAELARQYAAALAASLPPLVPTVAGAIDPAVAETIRRSIREGLDSDLLTACSAWLCNTGLWPAAQTELIRADAARILPALPPIPLPTLSDGGEIAASVWGIPALIGGLAGGLLLPWPLTAGGLGAAASAGGLVWALGHLSSREPIRAILSGRPTDTARPWLVRILHRSAALLLQAFVRPRQSGIPADALAQSLTPLLEERLLLGGALILSAFWAHPARLPALEAGAKPAPAPQPAELWLAVRRLEAALETGDGPDVAETAQEVVQRFAEEGYTWRTLQSGERYEGELRRMFQPFGRVDPDDRLVLLEPALLRHGVLIKPGRVRAAKDALVSER